MPRRTGRSARSCASARSVLATATPVSTAHALDLHGLLAAGQAPGLAGRRQFEAWVRFDEVQGSSGGALAPSSILDAELEHLAQVLQGCSIRSDIATVTDRLPRVRRQRISVRLSPNDAIRYARAAHMASLDDHHRRQQASRSDAPLTHAAVGYLTGRHGNQHTHAVVFTENHDILDPLIAALSRRGSRELHRPRMDYSNSSS